MRILFLARSLETGGAERQIMCLANGLAALGHDVGIAVFYSGGGFEEDLRGVSLLPLGKTGRWDLFGFLIRLRSAVRGFAPDVLYSFMTPPNILSVFCPVSCRVWGIRASDMDLSQYDWMHAASHFIEARLSRFASCIIANSHAGAAVARQRGMPAGALCVVPNGIDTDAFSPKASSPQEIAQRRHAWKADNDAPVIALVGRIDPMKDHATFLRAAAKLVPNVPNLRVVIVGDGDNALRTRLTEQAAALGLTQHIIWHGPERDMPRLYPALDVLCLTSAWGEGFPNVVGEAMACGVPCVVTDVGDAAHVVGEAGRVVPPENPTAIAAAIHALLSLPRDERRRLGHAARQRIIDVFSVKAMLTTTQTHLRCAKDTCAARSKQVHSRS
ncbi:glycosyltransferase [Desulfobaculum sp. SPO524]|uniref:glycosyltransferase n=1 Tax=Desulfobaculum sp. SPO524 TaxID=3378071 RepID=UPI003852E15E